MNCNVGYFLIGYNDSMVKTSRWFSFVAAIFLLIVSWESVQAQVPDIEYFAETGHNVKGDFLRYYRSIANPTIIYGYPITEQFTSKDGNVVQYFQRARFELATDPVQKVKLTPLGSKTYKPERQLVINNPLACREYSQTGYSVCFAFLEFFDQYGGVAQFGYPISPFEFRNNQIVQYFENARFEWRPGASEGQRTGITDVGRIYFDQIGEDPAQLKPAPRGTSSINPDPGQTVLDLQVRAFPAKAVTTSSDQQTIYVLVQDQNLQPVAGGNGVASIRLPSGETQSQSFIINERGVGTFSFTFQRQPNGQLVYLNIFVFYNGLQGKTTTSFRIWY